MRVLPTAARRVLCLSGLLLALSLGGAAGAAERYIDRTATDYDIVTMADGKPVTCNVESITSDGAVVVSEPGHPGTRTIPAGQWRGPIEERRTLAQVVERRGKQALDRGDLQDLIETLKWAREKKVTDAGLALAEKVLVKQPSNTDIGTLALQFYIEKGDQNPKAEALARRLLAADPHWNAGFEFVAKLLASEPARADDLATFVQEWLKAQPTAFTPNKIIAGIAERTGDFKGAQEAYRKCYEMHKDIESGLGYARLSLTRGERDKALDVANALIHAGMFVDEAKVIAGSALLAQGDAAGALGLLQDAIKGTLSEGTAKLARYNLGLALWRGGQGDQARSLWKELGTPISKLALAILERAHFDDVESLPTPGLKSLAKQLNACVDLEHGHHAEAALLDRTASKRDLFLAELGDMIKSGISGDSLRTIAGTPGDESLRWQAYGQLLTAHYAEAEALLAHLPEDDGYAAVYRVYAAEGRKDGPRARDLYQKAVASKNPPRDYLARLSAFYASALDESETEHFNWPPGEAPGGTWQYSAPGTNIHLHAANGQLLIEGTQSASPDAVSRAWKVVSRDRLKAMRATFDLTGVGAATGGVELLDEQRTNGVELGVLSDNRLGWRELKSGAWGEWLPLALQVQGTKAVLVLELNAGRVLAVSADDVLQKFPIGSPLPVAAEQLSVGVFGTSAPGAAWKIAVDEVLFQYKATAAKPRQ